MQKRSGYGIYLRGGGRERMITHKAIQTQRLVLRKITSDDSEMIYK